MRSRIKRGTLQAVRESGVVVVLLDGDRQTTNQPTGEDDQPGYHDLDSRDALIEELRDRVRSLEEANRENRRIIAGLVQHLPELEAPDSPDESYDGDHESRQEPAQREESNDEGYTPPATTTEPQTGSQRPPVRRAPWWRRIFGGG